MDTDFSEKLSIGEHIKNIKKLMGKMKEIDALYFPLCCITHLINAVIPYLELILSAYVLDALTEGRSFKEIFLTACLFIVAIFILRCIAGMVWNRMEVRAYRLNQIYDFLTMQKVMNMDYATVQSPKTEQLKQRIERDNNWGAGLYNAIWSVNSLLFGMFSLFFAIIVGAPVLYYIAVSGKPVIYILFFGVIILGILGKKLGTKYSKRVMQFMYRNDLDSDEDRKRMCSMTWSYAYSDGFSYKNGKEVRLCGGCGLLKSWTIEREEMKERIKQQKETAGNEIKGTFLDNIGIGSQEAGAYVIVGLLALFGSLSVGSIVKLAGCLRGIFARFDGITINIKQLVMTARRQASTLEFLELYDGMYKGKLPVEKRNDKQYRIEFKNVSFKYPGTDFYALRNFSLTLKVGEKLAIVGMNGSGKTTMIKLLCRLYDPDEGEILLNGVDIKKFKHDEYSRLFSVIFQDFKLFSFKLAETVAITREYDKNKVEACLLDLGMGEMLKKLPNGIESYLYKDYDDDGIEISGGEAQKIAIARAVYKDSAFILMDEPTAALDPIAEYEVYSDMDKIVGDKTAIYISHRLSACRLCQKIAVFHEGHLVQLGSHDELVRDVNGKYYELWNAQAQYYIL